MQNLMRCKGKGIDSSKIRYDRKDDNAGQTADDTEQSLWGSSQFTDMVPGFHPDAGTVLYSCGNIGLLHQPLVGLLCSKMCPGRLILRTHDLAHRWRADAIAVVSGFHSPIKQECLAVLLRGSQPIILCLARSITDYRLPVALRAPVANGRLLILSPFKEGERRMTKELAAERNRLVAALSACLVVPYADPGGTADSLIN